MIVPLVLVAALAVVAAAAVHRRRLGDRGRLDEKRNQALEVLGRLTQQGPASGRRPPVVSPPVVSPPVAPPVARIPRPGDTQWFVFDDLRGPAAGQSVDPAGSVGSEPAGSESAGSESAGSGSAGSAGSKPVGATPAGSVVRIDDGGCPGALGPWSPAAVGAPALGAGGPAPSGAAPAAAVTPAAVVTPGERRAAARRRLRPTGPLAATAAVLAVVVLLAAAALAGLSLSNGGSRVAVHVPPSRGQGRPGTSPPSGRSSSPARRGGTSPSGPAGAPSPAVTSPPASAAPAPVTPGPPVPSPAGGTARATGAVPVLAAISPATGAAGQVVTITGRGLFSSDGVITVSFGGRAAPIACPTETTCHVTVPARGRGDVDLTITTDAGTSNAVRFGYS